MIAAAITQQRRAMVLIFESSRKTQEKSQLSTGKRRQSNQYPDRKLKIFSGDFQPLTVQKNRNLIKAIIEKSIHFSIRNTPSIISPEFHGTDRFHVILLNAGIKRDSEREKARKLKITLKSYIDHC